MNRYDIFRLPRVANDLPTHAYKADAPMQHNAEWGLLERIKPERDCSPAEIAGALERIEETDPMSGEVRVSYRLPQTYQVVVTDISAEVAAELQARADRKDFIDNIDQRIDDAFAAATTVAAVKAVTIASLKKLARLALKG